MGSCRAGTLYDPPPPAVSSVPRTVPGAECVPSRYLLNDKWMSEQARLLGETVSICALSPGGKGGMPAARTTFGRKQHRALGHKHRALGHKHKLGARSLTFD